MSDESSFDFGNIRIFNHTIPRSGVFKALLAIALPMMLGSAIEAVYNLTDAFFLGRLGAAEIGAPSIAFSIVFFLTVFGIGLSSAGTTLIAQSKGKNDPVKMNHYLNQMASLLMTTSIVLAIIGALIAPSLLRLLNTPPDIYGFALSYIRIVFLGIPFVFTYFTLQASFTAIGDSLTPVKVHLIAVAFNVILDPILIFGLGPVPALGVSGAAIATIVAQGLGAILSIVVLVRGRDELKLSRLELKPTLKSWGLLLRIGLPASVGQGLSSFGFTVLQGVVNIFGTSAIAAFGVGNRLFNMFNIPTHGIAGATSSLVGRAMGAKDTVLAKRVVLTRL